MNEDNCVLDTCDLETIEVAFKDYLKACSNAGKEYLIMETKKIISKINKLNEMAKQKSIQEKINDDNHICTGEPPF